MINRRQLLAAGTGLGAALVSGIGSARAASQVVWNVKTRYGTINQASLATAIADAKAYLAGHPGDVLVLQLDSGTHTLNNTNGSTNGVVDLSGVNPPSGGRLVFQGAGPDATTLKFDGTIANLYGRNVSFESMHMTQAEMKVSQGMFLSATPGVVYLDISAGFPTPSDIYDGSMTTGRYLRAYDITGPLALDPHIIDNEDYPSETNVQIPWKNAIAAPTADKPNRWRIELNNANQVAGYNGQQLIGIKSKHGGDAYWFGTGSDFVFDDIKWTGESRGVFRLGFNDIRISNCNIRRAGPINNLAPALACPGGGPQLGQPGDAGVNGVLVENCTFVGAGDDLLGLFNVQSGTVRNSVFGDGFARVLLYNSCGVQYEGLGNSFIRTPVVEESPQCAASIPD